MIAARRAPRYPVGLAFAGWPRPALPVSVLAEDFSLLIRYPRRFRIARSRIRVLG